jgi:4-diphosphocytidyl-2-C-methyl-D-erythritol kinase
VTAGRAAVLLAPAKLTISLEVVARRADGYHDIRAEMVTVDLFDRLVVDPDGDGVEIVAGPGSRADHLSPGPDNLVSRAVALVGRTAAVRVEKRIPVGGGLGGGSTDAAAILRWAGVDELDVAARLGGDVPFCVRGGHALVEGIGERVTALPHEDREFVLLVPPFGVDTASAYRRWDELQSSAAGAADQRQEQPAPEPQGGRNQLTPAALDVEPRLAAWRDALFDVTRRSPVLAGSGSTWFVEGSAEDLGVVGQEVLVVGLEEGRLIPVRTVPAGWAGSEPGGAPE